MDRYVITASLKEIRSGTRSPVKADERWGKGKAKS